MKKLSAVLLFGSIGMFSACSGTGVYSAKQDTKENPENTAKHKADYDAILSMQGEYEVGFHFQETVVLKDGYTIKEPKDVGAFETVIVVKDEPNHIVLQHILVSEGSNRVIKHWRQDWFYEAKERFEFSSDQTWKRVALDDDKTKGAWTQCVYEVSDAPRYCGTGRFNHKYGVATWTSDRTWRPLPRREYTTRDDYNALNAENRHTITPNGWTHEQDNTKTIRSGEDTFETLVREFGFNDYKRTDDFDFSPAYEYWDKTSQYWAKVRSIWTETLQQNESLTLKTEVDGMPIVLATFEHADEIAEGNAEPSIEDIRSIFNEWVSLND